MFIQHLLADLSTNQKGLSSVYESILTDSQFPFRKLATKLVA